MGVLRKAGDLGGAARRFGERVARAPIHHPAWVFALIVLASFCAGLAVIRFPVVISHSVFVPVLVAAGLFLSRAWLVRGISVVLVSYAVAAWMTWGVNAVQLSVLVVMALVVAIVAPLTRARSGASVPLTVGSGMLSELRDRLDIQATIPQLPEHYHVESHVMPARGDAFSGDFVVAARREQRLAVALTDVSGSGPSAATRALLLSGALSGLLAEMEPHEFLPAANRYLIRQGWRDGFASAIHLCLDMETGEFCMGTAGHPAAAQFRSGTRRWEMLNGAKGLLLGLFEQESEDYHRVNGQLQPGDAIVLYSDGIIEGPGGDLVAGTHQMLASAQSAMAQGMSGAAERICAASAQLGGADDRSAVVIWRDGVSATPRTREPVASLSTAL